MNFNPYPRKRCISCGNRFRYFIQSQLFCPDCKEWEWFCNTFVLRFQALQKISKRRIPRCSLCKERDIRVLVINHINGRQPEEKKLTSQYFYRKILTGERATKDLEVRCHNCNIRYEYGKRKNVFFDGRVLEKYLKRKKIIGKDDKIFSYIMKEK